MRKDLTAYLDEVAGTLGHPRRRKWCDAYLRGVLLDGHRKSVEPMAAGPKAVESGDEDYEQALPQFLSQSPWDEQGVLDALQAWVATRFGTAGVLILDDTGLPKQGSHSVGVARQYTGTLGKVASCQVAVALRFAAPTRVVARDARLYLPEAWAADRDRATKFRERLAADGRADGVGIDSTLEVIAADADRGPVPPHSGTGRPPTRPAKVRRGATSPGVRPWAIGRAADLRAVARPEGSRGRVAGRFAARRVRPAHQLSAGRVPLDPCWLLAEWPADAALPAKYSFSDLPAGTSPKRPVAPAEGRWWVEHSYRELKDELGLDHVEGRSWRGWNRHVVLVLPAYAFLRDVRRRRPKKVPPA